jgi:hypothetical protein
MPGPPLDRIASAAEEVPDGVDLGRRTGGFAGLADELASELVPLGVVADEVALELHLRRHDDESDLGNPERLVRHRV